MAFFPQLSPFLVRICAGFCFAMASFFSPTVAASTAGNDSLELLTPIVGNPPAIAKATVVWQGLQSARFSGEGKSTLPDDVFSGEEAYVRYYPSESCRLNISIFNDRGDPVRHFSHRFVKPQGSIPTAVFTDHFKWDLKSDDGNPVGHGVYHIRIVMIPLKGATQIFIRTCGVLRSH